MAQQIVDQYGKPIERGVLREPQTSRLGHLHREFATHPSRGLTPAKLARLLEDAEQGDLVAQHNLFLDMEEKDSHIYAEMSKRKRVLLTLDWDVALPRRASAQEKSDAAFVREVLEDIAEWEDVLLDALDAIGHGFACLEIDGWQTVEGVMLPRAIVHRPQSWFQTERDNRNVLRLRDNSVDGAPLQPFGWVVHTHRAKSGYLARAGLHRVLAWPYLFKNFAIADLAEFLEVYGMPLRVGKYPVGAEAAEKAALLRAVAGIGHNAAGIIPDNMLIEFVEATSSGSQDPYGAMVAWCERSQSKAILGGTLTSQADGKSSTNALGKVHNEVRHDLLVSDARQLAGTVTRDLIYPLIALNRGARDVRRLPRLTFDTREPEDLSLYAEALPKLIACGLPVTVNYVLDKLCMPEAEEGEALMTAPAVSVADTPSDASAERKTGPAALKSTGGPVRARSSGGDGAAPDLGAGVRVMADRLDREGKSAWQAVLEHIWRLVDEAESLPALQDALLAAYDGLPLDDLRAVMESAFAVAQLAGLSDVADEVIRGV